MLVVDDGLGDGLQRSNDAVLDEGRGFRHPLWPILAHQVELQTAQVPLTTQSVIVLSGRLLNCDVCQVHVGILNLFNLVRVAMMRESSEASTVQVHCQGLVARHKHVDSQVKLFAANKQWIHDVLLDDVGFGLGTIWLPPEVILPLRDLCELVQQEDATPLRLPNWLHNPDASYFAELLDKERVITWQVVRCREKVETAY